jgi:glucose/arabinose dehydrogenase
LKNNIHCILRLIFKRNSIRNIGHSASVIIVFIILAFSLLISTYHISNASNAIYLAHAKQTSVSIKQNSTASAPLSSLIRKLHFSPDLTVTINSGPAPNVSNFNITKGYKIEPVLWNLNLPSSTTFDSKGNMYIAEAGYAIGELETTPRILKLDRNGTISVIASKGIYPPITDIAYHDGKIYVANRGKISTIDVQDKYAFKDIVLGLPSIGDYSVNQLSFGGDGRLYFGIGSATNSGVVGPDNYEWLKLLPSFHDILPKSVKLTEQTFTSPNPLTPIDRHDEVLTGAFAPFGNTTLNKGQFVHGSGDLKCSACIISSKLDGGDIKLVGWGIRNPIGLEYNQVKKTLLVTDSGAEERGSRPIANDTDKIFDIDLSNQSTLGKFYGWPDYFGNAEPITNQKSHSLYGHNINTSKFLMQEHPPVQKPFAMVKLSGIGHVALTNTSSTFGFKNKAFATEIGKIRPTMDKENSTKDAATTGQKIILFDPTKKGPVIDFVSQRKPNPYFRPIDVKFNDDNTALYIVSMGKAEIRTTSPLTGYQLQKPTPWFYQHTGIIWKITNLSSVVGMAATQPPKKLHLSPEITVTINTGPPPHSNIFRLPPGYVMQPVLWNLNMPGSFAFDSRGNMYIASTGITYGKLTTNPHILKVDKNGTVSVFTDRFLHGILADIEYDKGNGLLYVSHRALISAINLTSGIVTDLVTSLPMTDYGTHPMGQIAIGGPEKRIYFGVGSVSNTAIPDVSDFGIGWIRDMPELHEVPASDIKLTGQNFQSHNFLEPQSNETVITGGFMPFGVPARDGQIIKGSIKCNACLLSIRPNGSDLRVEAWGIRNPYGLVMDNNNNRLYAASNGDDDKGIRRVTNDPDKIFMLDITKTKKHIQYNNNNNNNNNLTFFGWPDFPGDGQSISDPVFNQSPRQNYINLPLIKDPPPVTQPFMLLGIGVAVAQAAISTNDSFGYPGKIFVTQFGTIDPVTHTFLIPKYRSPGQVMGQTIGQKVIIIDPTSLGIRDFVSLKTNIDDFRPVGLQFSPDGRELYLTSIEKHQIRDVTPTGVPLPNPEDWPFQNTGTVWKITQK